jgi:hypothetical protein
MKTIFIIYLYFLGIDAILRSWKVFALIIEYGFLSFIFAVVDFISAYVSPKKNYALLKLIGHFHTAQRVRSFNDVLSYPTKIIDAFLTRIAVCCVMRKAQKSGISHENLIKAMFNFQSWFSDAGMASWPKKIPILGQILSDILFILEYHYITIFNIFSKEFIVGVDEGSQKYLIEKRIQKDLFYESPLVKLFRLVVADALVVALMYTFAIKF